MAAFYEQVKSTIDKAGVDIAVGFGPSIKFIDLDSADMNQELLTKGDDAIVWELATMEEDPVDPLYSVVFGIGARTLNDPGRYNMAALLGAVRAVFAKGESINVFDFSTGGDGVTKTGFLYVTDVSIDPQMFDKQAGIRFVMIVAKAVRLV